MSTSQEPQRTLDYARPGRRRISPLAIDRFFKGLLVATILFILWMLFGDSLRFWYRSRTSPNLRYLRFSQPPGKVVYEEDPAAVAQLLKSNEYHRVSGDSSGIVGAAYSPAIYHELLRGFSWTKPQSPLLFMHERQSPSGVKRLVVVNCTFVRVWGAERMVPSWEIWNVDFRHSDPPSFVRSHDSSTYLRLLNARSLRLFAGQADPNDLSHFTIAYSYDHQNGTIDGNLVDGQEGWATLVTLNVRDGPLK
jgi:hypothetical protein